MRAKALWMMRDLDAARTAATSAIARNPAYAWAHGVLAAVLAEQGEVDAARDAAATARRLNRRFSGSFAAHVLPYRTQEPRHRIVQAWRLAGMPEHEGAAQPAAAFGA